MKHELEKQIEMLVKDDEEMQKTIIYLSRRIDKATKEVKELYEMAKEQDSDNVNLIDRLELILKTIGGEDNE